MVARRPFLLSSTIPGYAGDHKGPLHSSPPPSPLRIRVLRRRLPPKKPTRERACLRPGVGWVGSAQKSYAHPVREVECCNKIQVSSRAAATRYTIDHKLA